MRLAWIVPLVVLAGAWACGDDETGTSIVLVPTSSGPGAGPGPGAGGASSSSGAGGVSELIHGAFTIDRGGMLQAVDWQVALGNHVFCRHFPDFFGAGRDYLWLRFAESSDADGEASPHIDIDVCDYGGTDAYAAIDPLVECTGPGFDIWWHEAEFESYVNKLDSDPCALSITADGDEISGLFECDPLVKGEDELAVRYGTFRCPVEPGETQ